MRNLRRAAVAAGLAVAILAGTADAGHAELWEPELHYQGAMSSTTVDDSSEANNIGTVLSANGGAITSATDPHSENAYLHFPAGVCATPPCPQAVIRPTSSADLAPRYGGLGTFRFGATIRLTDEASQDAGMNLFQRGLAVKGQSQWKLQADYGYATCRWSDGTNVELLPSLHDPRFKLNLNTWYIATCARWPLNIFTTSLIDRRTGKVVAFAYEKNDAVGAVVPAATTNATIGGKKINPTTGDVDTDQYHGDMDDIFFDAD